MTTRTTFRCIRLLLCQFSLACLAAASLFAIEAEAGTILVGKTPGVCTKYTLESAIKWANELDGYNVIIVTDDAPSGEYRENVHVGDLKPGLQLEIHGGYRSCTDPVPSGSYTRIRGASTGAPVLRLGGDTADVSVTGLVFSGGSNGIELDGPIKMHLADDVHVVDNQSDGIRLHYSGGADATVKPRLDLRGSVEVARNGGAGIRAHDKGVLEIQSTSVRVWDNGGHGVEMHSPSEARIKGSGPTLWGNHGYGLWMESTASFSGVRNVYVDSIESAAPMEISHNEGGAVYVRAPSAGDAYHAIVGDVILRGNTGRPIHVEGIGATLAIDPGMCRSQPSPGHGCGIFDNESANGALPLIAAIGGARIALDGMWISGNNASAILSTNLGTGVADSSITLRQSIVTGNTLRDNVFESLNGGSVQIDRTTVMANGGFFGVSFVSIDPLLLQTTDSIIDQPQRLLIVEGDGSTTHFQRVLAPNRDGASAEDDIPLGRAIFRDEVGRLAVESPGTDYAPAAGNSDFEGAPRNVDLPGVGNGDNPRDLGAFETSIDVDWIFWTGFER